MKKGLMIVLLAGTMGVVLAEGFASEKAEKDITFTLKNAEVKDAPLITVTVKENASWHDFFMEIVKKLSLPWDRDRASLALQLIEPEGEYNPDSPFIVAGTSSAWHTINNDPTYLLGHFDYIKKNVKGSIIEYKMLPFDEAVKAYETALEDAKWQATQVMSAHLYEAKVYTIKDALIKNLMMAAALLRRLQQHPATFEFTYSLSRQPVKDWIENKIVAQLKSLNQPEVTDSIIAAIEPEIKKFISDKAFTSKRAKEQYTHEQIADFLDLLVEKLRKI